MRTLFAGAVLVAAVMIAATQARAQVFASGSIGGPYYPPPAAEVARRLGHANLSVRRRGAKELLQLGPDVKKILSTVKEALADDDLEVRTAAALCLARLDPSVEGIGTVLAEGVEAASSVYLIGIARTLLELEPERTPHVVERLIAVVRDKNNRMRSVAVQALEAIGPPAKPALPVLVECLEGDDSQLQCSAARALARIGCPGVVPALVAALGVDDRYVREDAASALLSIGLPTRAVGQALLDELKVSEEVSPDSSSVRSIDKIAAVVPDTVEQLIAMTAADHRGVRYHGAAALGHLGKSARAAVPALLKLLSDPDRMVRCAAARALGQVAQPRDEVVAALAEALKDPHPQNRTFAVMSLGLWADDKTRVEPILVEALGDEDRPVAALAAAALGSARLYTLLNDGHHAVRARAARSIGGLHLPASERREAAMPLIEALADGNEDVRRAAAGSLGAIAARVTLPWAPEPAEPKAADRDWVVAQVIPALCAVLEDPQAPVRAMAAAALAGIGLEANPAVDQLAEVLARDGDANVREHVARALGLAAADAESAAPALAKALRDQEPRVRSTAAASLYRISASGDDVRTALLDALANSDPQTRMQAALALGRCGPAGGVAPSLLRVFEDDPDASVRQYAAMGLAELDPPGAAGVVPTLVEALSGDLGSSAAQALIQIGKKAPAITPQVIDVLKSDNRDAVHHAIFVLKEIGATNAAPALIRMVGNSGDGGVVDAAVAALSELGPDAKETVAVVVDFDVGSGTDRGTDALARILRDIGPAVVPELVRYLDDDQPRRRQLAARALGDCGMADAAALTALRGLLGKESDESVRWTALEAIRNIDRDATSDDR